jgi:hypothetical protein
MDKGERVNALHCVPAWTALAVRRVMLACGTQNDSQLLVSGYLPWILQRRGFDPVRKTLVSSGIRDI